MYVVSNDTNGNDTNLTHIMMVKKLVYFVCIVRGSKSGFFIRLVYIIR